MQIVNQFLKNTLTAVLPAKSSAVIMGEWPVLLNNLTRARSKLGYSSVPAGFTWTSTGDLTVRQNYFWKIKYSKKSFIHSMIFTLLSYHSKDYYSCYIFWSSYPSTLSLQYKQLLLRKANIVIRSDANKYHLWDKRIMLK